MDGSINWNAVQFAAPGKLTKVSDIMAATVLHFRISSADLRGDCRRRDLARARQVVFFLAREMTSASYPAIASQMGGKDHSTAIWGAKKIKELIEDKRENMIEHVAAIREMILSGDPKAALKQRETEAKRRAAEALASDEAADAVRTAERVSRFRRLRDLADAGFIATDVEGRIVS